MARVMKKFETEEEYQEWVDSPWMRTPYTCFVRSTGNVHYEEGRDDDYSITAVIKMTGWICIATRGMMKYIDKIYKNGIEKDFRTEGLTDEESPDFTYACRQTYYYRKFNGCTTQYYKLNDYLIPYGLYAHHGCSHETLVDMGVTDPGSGLNLRKRFAKTKFTGYRGKMDMDTYGGCGSFRRFLFVEKGDVVKIVFNSEFTTIRHRVDLLGNGQFRYEVPKICFLNKYASEITIGDGFEQADTKIIKMERCKKIFLGKRMKNIHVPSYEWGYDKKRIFIRGDVNFHGSMPDSKIIYL